MVEWSYLLLAVFFKSLFTTFINAVHHCHCHGLCPVITTTQINSALHPSAVAKSRTSFGWNKSGKVTTAGWQVKLCDSIWHMVSLSGEVIFNVQLLWPFYLLSTCYRDV